jgi:hypothetical protein
MPAAIAALPLPDLTALLLVGGVSLFLAILAWPLIRLRTSNPADTAAEPANTSAGRTVRYGLAGQWARNTRRIEARIETQRHAVGLHRKAADQLGAIDYEIDRLLRDMRAIFSSPGPTAAL